MGGHGGGGGGGGAKAVAAAVSAARTVVAASIAKAEKKVSPRKLLMQKKAQQAESQASASLLFHCSGVTSKQWRELKNSLAPIQGRALFQPNFKSTSARQEGQFTSKIAASAGPLCMLYLGEEAADDRFLKLLPPSSMSDSMLLLYGKQRSNLLNHLDVKKAANLDLAGVYRRGVFSAVFNPMAFFSGLDRLKAAKDSEGSGEGAAEGAEKESGEGTSSP